MAHVDAPAVNWVPSRKVVTQLVVNVLGFVVALVVTKAGIHESATAAGVVSTVIGIVAGAVAAYWVPAASTS